MIISHIKMKNWRNFRNVDTPLGRRMFLVGANASGKSNFLDALRFLRDIAKTEGGGLQRAVSERGGISKIRCLAARKEPQVEIEKALKIAVPQLIQLTDTRDERGIPHLEAIYEHWRPKAGKQSEDQFSDGTLHLIGFLWSILDGDSLLLMEEPELSLHSAIVKKLPGLIWRIQSRKKRQIIISTHSFDLLSDKGIGGEEVLLLTPDVEGTNVELASSVKDVKILLDSGFSISEAALPKTEPKNLTQLSLFKGKPVFDSTWEASEAFATFRGIC